MAEYTDREHYIPLRKGDLIDLLCADPKVSPDDREPLRQFCKMIGAVYHFEYLERLERLKDCFAPFDADARDGPLAKPTEQEREKKLTELFAEFTALMERANFQRLSRDDIQAAVEGGASDWGLNMSVDFALFDRLEAFVRGEGKTIRIKQHPILFWRKEPKQVETFERIVLMLKLRPHKRLPENVDTEDVFLKLFKDIPKLDLEMVLPGAQIQMPRFQRGKLGASLLGTVGYALWNVWAQLLAAVKFVVTGTWAGLTAAGTALWGPVVLLAGYGYKQWYGFQVTKQTYSKMLTESLYFQTLDNNLGVMTRVLDEAEEQECREAILAYFCLLHHAPPGGWAPKDLDDFVEMYLEGRANLKVDFEIGDAMNKLEQLRIVEKSGEHYRAVSLPEALERLDYRWDNYFQYNKAVS